MKILLECASNWHGEKLIEAENLETVLNDLRNGNIDISDLVEVSSSFLCDGDKQDENPNSFVVAFPKDKEDKEQYDCRITIYDYYME